MTKREVMGKVKAGLLHSDLGVESSIHLTHRVVKLAPVAGEGPRFAQGLSFTRDPGNEHYAAWMIHVCGDALAAYQLKNPAEIGNILEAILGFCQLSVEFPRPIQGCLHMSFIPAQLAYAVWSYVEDAIRTYEGYVAQQPN